MTNTTFADALKKETIKTTTENGAKCYNTTTDALVDLFAVIGAIRNASDRDTRLHLMIDNCYAESPELLAKMIFYARDIRGGLGERDTFREAIKYCARYYPAIIESNIMLIPEYGRWDDYFALRDTPLEGKMWGIIQTQLLADRNKALAGQTDISLLAKWLPTADASSQNTRRFGCEVARNLGMSVYDYKRAVRDCRRVLKTVEEQMSANKWAEIRYDAVPSRAMLVHSPAFRRHDEKGFVNYLGAVAKGGTTIHSDTLYPYDIARRILFNIDASTDAELIALWNALPNYIDTKDNVLVCADTSGSMTCDDGLPMASAVGLALYFAQRNHGPLHNVFMTFESTPHFFDIGNGNIADTLRKMARAPWGGSTDLGALFKQVLRVAEREKMSQEDLPKSIIIISDMEFNQAVYMPDKSFYKSMKKMYKDAGYTIPNVVFWNVNSRRDTYHVKKDTVKVQCFSGHSVATFKMVIDCVGMTPYECMLKTLNQPRYEPIKVVQ